MQRRDDQRAEAGEHSIVYREVPNTVVGATRTATRSHWKLLALVLVFVAAACGSTQEERASSTSEPATSTTTTSAPAELRFPEPDWPQVEPADAGFDPAALDEAAAIAEETGSHCLAVIRNGELVGEWAFGDFGENGTMAWFSVTKSMMAVLVGMAQTDGLLDIGDPASAYVESWQGTDSEEVTIRDLLGNVSGRELTEEIDSALLTVPDQTAYAVGLGQEAEPAEVWVYNGPAVQVLERVLASALEPTGQDPVDYAQTRLLDPLGLAGPWATDTAGNLLGHIGYTGTCDEALRFGHLALALGEWDGEQLVDAEFVREATRGASQDRDQSYGLLWWRNTDGGWLDQDDELQDSGLAYPGAPIDMFSAQGLGGQMVTVFPSSGVVIARLSPILAAQYDRDEDPLLAITAAVAEAIVDP